MQILILAIRDAKADCFLRPFYTNTVGVGIRQFTDEVNREDRENPLNQHPDDFALYEIGTFDDNTGKIYQPEIPKLLIQADQVKTSKSERHLSLV